MIMRQVFLHAILGLSCLSRAWDADIRADSNRDGVVDMDTAADLYQDLGPGRKENWIDSYGAIFLANIGDTNRRCSRGLGPSSSNEELDDCHDASDNIQRSPKYMAPIRTAPMADLSLNAVGRISVEPAIARSRTRIFRRRGANGWAYTEDSYSFRAGELRAGLTLGIDARDVRRTDWDGRATVRFTVSDGGFTKNDTVMLRVAPVLAHHHLQEVNQVVVTGPQRFSPPEGKLFVKDLRAAVAKTGITKDLLLVNYNEELTDHDIWAQDYFEPAYTSMPGPGGSLITLRILIRSAQSWRDMGRAMFLTMRKSGWGAVQELGGDQGSIASFGNLEMIPPYSKDGEDYPVGRILTGRRTEKEPFMTDFFRAQEVQNPIVLDTDWLDVGHIDEFLQFLPANTPRGWAMMVADPAKARALLEQARSSGAGLTRAFSKQDSPESWVCKPVPELTVNDVLAQTRMWDLNDQVAQRIAANIDIIKGATGITDQEIFRMPTVFSMFELGVARNSRDQAVGTTLNTNWNCNTSGNGQSVCQDVSGARRPASLQNIIAYYPAVVNSLVLSGTKTIVAPKPWGPIVGGKDIFEQAAIAEYAKLGLKVTFIDEWCALHGRGGEVHCGSNSIRNVKKPWW